MTATSPMSTPKPSTTKQRLYLPQRRLFDRQEFQQILDFGVFGPEERFELINGEIVEKELPRNTPHATSQGLAEDILREVFGQGYVVRSQVPLALGPHTEPLSDIAVVTGVRRNYRKSIRQPRFWSWTFPIRPCATTAPRKPVSMPARVFRSTGFQLTKRRLEVYRDPQPLRGAPLGHHYASRTFYEETASVAPIAAPQSPIAVRDMLPRS